MTPMLAARPDLTITGIDWRTTDARPGTVIRGDVLTHDWPAGSFDAIVGISSIEHLGLGHYDQDPVDDAGDRHCMTRVTKWLRPGGWAYLDVPFDADGYRVHSRDEYRVYDAAALRARLVVPGLRSCRAWYVPSGFPAWPGHGLSDTPVRANFQYVALWLEKPRDGEAMPC